MKKRIAIITVAAVVLLATLLFIFYRPEKTEVTLYCSEITADCEVLNTGSFILEGWRTSKPTSKLHITKLQILDLEANTKYSRTFAVQENPAGMAFDELTGFVYFEKNLPVMIAMGNTSDWAAIRVGDRLFVASTQEDFDPAAIRQKYQERFDSLFE